MYRVKHPATTPQLERPAPPRSADRDQCRDVVVAFGLVDVSRVYLAALWAVRLA